jgi:hypothetical protein
MYGSVRGAPGNWCPYRDHFLQIGSSPGSAVQCRTFLTHSWRGTHFGRPARERDRTLEAVCSKYLNLDLSKDEQNSFTMNPDLTQEQIDYAANEVRVLKPIYKRQKEKLAVMGLRDVAALEFSIIPPAWSIWSWQGMC